MKDNNIGNFDKEYQVWNKYPNGGVEGDFCTIGDVTYLWNTIKRRWEREIPTPNSNHSNQDFDGNIIIREDLHVGGKIYAYGIEQPSKGLFETSEALKEKYPERECHNGDWALVLTELAKEPQQKSTFAVWRWSCSGWYDTKKYTEIELPIDMYVEKKTFYKYLALGYVYGGYVNTDAKPKPERDTFYLATDRGVYMNMGGVEIKDFNGLYAIMAVVDKEQQVTWKAPVPLVMLDDVNKTYENRTMSQKGIHNLAESISISSTGIIRTSELNNVPKSIDRAVLKNYIYVNDGGTTVGQILCFAEGTGLLYTQVVFTHYKPNESGDFAILDYGKVHIFKRSYFTRSHESHGVGWTDWEDVRESEFKEVANAIDSLSKRVDRNSSDLRGSEVNMSSDKWAEGFIQTRIPAEKGSPVEKEPSPNPPGFSWKTAEVMVSEGDKFIVKADGGVEARAWNFLDEKRLVLTQSGDSEKINGEITAPRGAVSLLLNSNSNDCFVKGGKRPVWVKKKIKILLFGNSFTRDAFSYVPAVMKQINPDVDLKIAIAYIGGSSLAQHLASFSGQPQTIAGTIYTPRDYKVTISENGEPWGREIVMDADSVLSIEDWDIVTFQQNGQGAYQDYEVYYKPFAYPLLEKLYSKLGNNVKVGWVLIHGSYGSSKEQFYEHWKGGADNAQKLISTTETSILFPYGTAIENLRTTDCFNLGDGSGHGMTADNAHLQEGIGCLCAAYSNCLTILNAVGINYTGVVGNNINIDRKFIEDNNVPEPNFGTSNSVIGITEPNLRLAQIAAENAVKYPYMVTDLVNKEYRKLDVIGGMYDLQKQIDVIVVGNTKLTISVSPNIFFEGVSTDVTVKAQLVGAKGKITIGGKVSPNNAYELTITDSITNTKRYKATAVVKGQIINSNEAVATATKPYFVGAGNAYTDVSVEKYKHGPSFSAKGTYQFDVKQNEKIYIIVPNNFSVKSVTFVEGGFGLPVEISSTETLEGYKIYVSAERKEGSYNIKIE